MKITILSDLHGTYPTFDTKGEPGDLLLICGDLTANDEIEQYEDFIEWLVAQDFKCKVFIGGNHDVLLSVCPELIYEMYRQFDDIHYLLDDGIEFKGVKIWGTPWQKRFDGQNPDAMAFSLKTESGLKEMFEQIPTDVDILMSHSPPYSILDDNAYAHCGSVSLYEIVHKVNPKLHCFGHIHECGQSFHIGKKTFFYNAAYLDSQYRPRDEIHEIDYDKDIGVIYGQT